MRFFDSESSFKYAWEDVTKANWRKYPNEITTHVESVDVLRREVDPSTGVLRTERLIGCRQPIPTWINKLLGTNGRAYCREVSEIDPKTGTLVMRSRNLDHCSVLSVLETVTYKRDPSSPHNRTLFTQQATFESSLSFKRVCARVEEFSMQRFTQNAQLGRAAFEQVLNSLSQKALA